VDPTTRLVRAPDATGREAAEKSMSFLSDASGFVGFLADLPRFVRYRVSLAPGEGRAGDE
jgi:hypothetical protein